MNRNALIPAMLLALALAWTGSAAAQLTADEAALVGRLEVGLSSGSPVAAKALSANMDLLAKVTQLDPDRGAALKAKASSIADYEALLDKRWAPEQMRNLSASLALRLTPAGPLSKVGLAPRPEATLDWAAKYKTYSADKTALLGKALKKWDVIFKDFTFAPKNNPIGGVVSWTVYDATGTYFAAITPNDFVFRDSEADMKAFWADLTLKERNDFLAAKAASLLSYFVDSSTRTDAAFQDRVKGISSFDYLDGSGKGKMDRYLSQMKAAEELKASLSGNQMMSLKDQPVDQQMYLLGSMFDKKEVKGGVVIERQIDANRPSRPAETISPQTNTLLSGMLRTSLVNEIKGTAPGDKVAGFYKGGAKLDIAIETCQGCSAKYEPSTGRIVIDSDLIQQYARANNLSSADLLKKENMAGLTKYISPIFVHEATHQMQHDWAAKAGVYKPYTQEDEIESNSMEALYTTQKRDTDPKFKSLFLTMGKASTYAQQRLELAKRYEGNQKEFGDVVRQQYYYGVPSLEAASAQILSAVSGELDRRKTMPTADVAEIDNTGKPLSEVKDMSAQEIADSVQDIRTVALKKIQADMLNKSLFTDHYAGAEDWAAKVLSGASTKKKPVPTPS